MDGDVLRILLQFRCKRAWIYPSCWAFFGGGVESGEHPSTALKREGLEEFGFLIRGHEPFRVSWHLKPGGVRVLDHTYLLNWQWHRLTICLSEGEDHDWFTIDDALALKSLPPHERSDLLFLQEKKPEVTGMALAA